MTFKERFLHTVVFWGGPMVCLELIGIPFSSWGFVILFSIPATLLGVLVYTTIEHWFYTGGK
jgi:hypothetical protein